MANTLEPDIILRKIIDRSIPEIADSEVTSIGTYKFHTCSSLASAVFPNALPGNSTFVFQKCTNLQAVDYGSQTSSTLANGHFNNCKNLSIIVLRATNAVWTLANTTMFNDTPFKSGGTGGTLYVPNALISTYQSATNWSTILGYANNQIKSIESTHTDPNAPVDLTTHYVDGTLIPTS